MTLAPWQQEAWRRWSARAQRGALGHALLLTGASGLGKRAFAAAFVRALLCVAPRPDGHACGECRACRLLAAGSHPDLINVVLELRDDGKLRSDIGVDQIRALGARLALTSQFGGRQLALVDPADALNPSAANALLKTLEEPTPDTVIILVTDHPMRLPATIRSRCQRIEFRMPDEPTAERWLLEQGIDIEKAKAALIASAGNPGMALAWVQAGTLELRNEIVADLRGLRSQRCASLEVANRWSKADPQARLWFAATIVQQEAHALAAGGTGPLALTATADLTKLSAWFDRVNRGRALLRGPVRPELVVLELMTAWRELGVGHRSNP